MSSYNLKRFAHPDTLRSIHPGCLLKLLCPHRAFFAGRGLTLPDAPAAVGAPPLDHGRLAKILVTPDADTPKDLADALYFIHEIEAMDALLAAVPLADLGCDFLGVTPVDVAVRVWLRDRQVLERAHAELSAARPRAFKYFQPRPGPLPPFAPPTAAQLRPMERVLDDVFEQKNRGRGARVFAYPHEHDCLFLVRHGDPYRREGALDGVEPSSVLYRPLRFDVVVYDLRCGTLRVHARSVWETSLYRGQFGRRLFGAMDHFPDEGRYTLEPLRHDREASLACAEVPQLKYVTLTSADLYWGGPYGEVERRKAKDLFAALRRRNGTLPAQPRLVRASFDVHFRGVRKPRPLVIEPPNVARYARDEDCAAVDQWLSLRGFIRHPVPETHDDVGAVLAGR